MNRFSSRIAVAVLAVLSAADAATAQGPGYYVGPLGHVRYRHHGHHHGGHVRNPDFWRNAAYIAADLGNVFVFGGKPGMIGGGGSSGGSGGDGGDVVGNPQQTSATIELATSSEAFQAHEDEMLRRADQTAADLAEIRAFLRLPPRPSPDGASGTPAPQQPVTKPPLPKPPVPVDGGGVIVPPRPPGS